MAGRRFIDGTFGQLHLRMHAPTIQRTRPLACLHMSPKSGRIFARFCQAMATDRLVLAHDYPGYGESDPPPATPPASIADYAHSLWDVLDALDAGSVDLLGYHTGALVAAEAARQQPQRIVGIVMVGAPVFTPPELAAVGQYFAPIPLDREGTRFATMWARVVEHAGPGASLEMLAESFAENLRAGEAYEWGHRAAFSYAPQFADVVSQLPHRITVINPADDLQEQTPRIGPFLRNGMIINRPDWGHGFLDAFTQEAVALVRQALAIGG